MIAARTACGLMAAATLSGLGWARREEPRPSFERNVLPVLAKAGCASRACHAADKGQNGLKLSLFNYDPVADADMIRRRADLGKPENSLFLRKPTASVAHGGGLRFAVDSAEYLSLLAWVRAGAPAPQDTDPKLVSLTVTPSPLRLQKSGASQPVRVLARFDDGVEQDVTELSRLSVTDPRVAQLRLGQVVAQGRGDAYMIARYPGAVASAPIVCDIPLATRTAMSSDFQPVNLIDERLAKRWERLGIVPSNRCTDSEFARRVSVDLIGLIPTAREARAFLAETDPERRKKLARSLMDRPEFADRWTQWWGDMLRLNSRLMQTRGAEEFHKYLRDSVATNKPVSEVARDLITATGRGFRNGVVNYYAPITSLNQAAATAGRVFMGRRLECAECHNHPYERWAQKDFYALAALWSKTRTKQGPEKDEVVIYDVQEAVEVRIEGRVGRPQALPAFPGSNLKVDFTGDLRGQFADYLLAPASRVFARAFVNRVWAQFFGRGIFNPVDDYRDTNPPVDEALLDALAARFVETGYDFKELLMTIVSSAAYQRSSKTNPSNVGDERFFSHFYARRLGAEAMVDSICQVTGVPEAYDDREPGTRAMQLVDTAQYSRFLDLFGRPNRLEVVCERNADPSLSQAMFLMNNGAIQGKIASESGALTEILKRDSDPKSVVGELYLSALARPPTATELSAILPIVEKATDRKKAFEDVLWAILNSREFQFQH